MPAVEFSIEARHNRLRPRNRLHRLFPGIYVKACNRIIEKFFHRTETVGALHTLENNSLPCVGRWSTMHIGHLLAAVFVSS